MTDKAAEELARAVIVVALIAAAVGLIIHGHGEWVVWVVIAIVMVLL